MAAASTKVLEEAMKLPVKERIRVAEELLASADAEGYEDAEENDAAVNAAWAGEVERRSSEIRDGLVRGLSIEEARRIVASDLSDKDS